MPKNPLPSWMQVGTELGMIHESRWGGTIHVTKGVVKRTTPTQAIVELFNSDGFSQGEKKFFVSAYGDRLTEVGRTGDSPRLELFDSPVVSAALRRQARDSIRSSAHTAVDNWLRGGRDDVHMTREAIRTLQAWAFQLQRDEEQEASL